MNKYLTVTPVSFRCSNSAERKNIFWETLLVAGWSKARKHAKAFKVPFVRINEEGDSDKKLVKALVESNFNARSLLTLTLTKHGE